MTGKADKRRPFAVAIVLIAAIGAALVAPVMIGARRGEPIPGSTVRADSRETVNITTPLTLFASPSVTLERGTVALVSSDDAGEGRVGNILRALVLGGGADLVLDGAKLLVDRSGSAVAPVASADGSAPDAAPSSSAPDATLPGDLAPIVSALSGFKFRSLTLLDCKIVLKTRSGAEAISISSAEILPGNDGIVSAKGRFELRGEMFDFDAAFRQRPENAADATVALRVAVKSVHLSASFNGRLSGGDHGQITAEGAELSINDLRGSASWLGASWPAGPGLGSFTAKGVLTLEERAIAFEHAQFTLDGNAASGALMMKLGAERPLIEGTLAFASFDIAPYATPSRPYALALASDWLSSIRIPGLASPSFLLDMDADIRISAGNVTSGSDRLGRCAASLNVKDGKLYGEIAELELEQGGRGEGQFTIDTSGAEPRYTLRADLNDIDLETIVAPRLGPAAIDGVGDAKIDVTASGASEADFARSMAGTVSVELGDGGRLGLDVEALPAVAAAATPVEGWGAVSAGSTAVSSFAARFTALNGVLTVNAVEATTGDRTVTASGTVDIDKNALDLVLSIAPLPGADSNASGKALGAFKIHGPWADPAITRAAPGKAADTGPRSAVPPG